jgi:hypothetical protein
MATAPASCKCLLLRRATLQGDCAQKRKNIGRELPVSFGLLRQRAVGDSDRGAEGALEAQPAAERERRSMPRSPSSLIIGITRVACTWTVFGLV